MLIFRDLCATMYTIRIIFGKDLLYMSIFISYRREGGKHIADDIYSILCKEYDIFLDTESLKNGYFDTAIIEEIKKCSDFIVLITETVFNRCS